MSGVAHPAGAVGDGQAARIRIELRRADHGQRRRGTPVCLLLRGRLGSSPVTNDASVGIAKGLSQSTNRFEHLAALFADILNALMAL